MREDADDVGPAFELLVWPRRRVGGAQPGAVGRRQREDRQPFGNGALEPTGQSRPAAGVLGTGQQEASAGLGLVGGVEDPAELGGDFLAAVLAGHVLHGVLHRSEEHTSELQSPCNLVCRLLLEKKKRRQILTGRAIPGSRKTKLKE